MIQPSIPQMQFRCPDSIPLGPCDLADWRLAFKGVADIESYEGKSVHGGLWAISKKDEYELDLYEGYPHLYEKKYLDVEICGESLPVLTYVMTSGKYNPPQVGYFKVIAISQGIDG